MANGVEPAFTITAPEGSFLEYKGRALFLFVPDGGKFKVHDATTALVYAKTRQFGLDLVRPRRPAPATVPAPPPPRVAEGPRYTIEDARAEVVPLLVGNLARRKPARAGASVGPSQPSLFGDP